MQGSSNWTRVRRAAIASASAGLVLVGCAKRAPAPLTEVVAVKAATLPATPADPLWKNVPAYDAALVVQDLVEPRLMVPSTPTVRVQALTDGTSVAFRLSWADSTLDDLPGAARFTDACAVQLPQGTAANVPAPQMGESSMPVEITYWSAAWQAKANGRGDSIQVYYPNASVDHYPFEARSLSKGSPEQLEMEKRYAPARAANRNEHPLDRPVQDLLAEGPGTLTPMPETRSNGSGTWAASTWSVVITRPLPEVLRGQARSQVAFAVWNGRRQEVGARKMRSVWIPLALGGAS